MKIYNFENFLLESLRDDVEVKIGLNDREFFDLCKFTSEVSEPASWETPESIYYYCLENGDKKYSIVCKHKTTGDIVGSLICAKRPIYQITGEYRYDGKDLRKMRPIEGVALAVKKEYRTGIIAYMMLKFLLDYCENNKIDYIWFGQINELSYFIDYSKKIGCKLVDSFGDISVYIKFIK